MMLGQRDAINTMMTWASGQARSHRVLRVPRRWPQRGQYFGSTLVEKRPQAESGMSMWGIRRRLSLVPQSHQTSPSRSSANKKMSGAVATRMTKIEPMIPASISLLP
jgi:hypothetical protein